jgi:hypothetical protein
LPVLQPALIVAARSLSRELATGAAAGHSPRSLERPIGRWLNGGGAALIERDLENRSDQRRLWV